MCPKLPQNGGQQIGAWCKKKEKKNTNNFCANFCDKILNSSQKKEEHMPKLGCKYSKMAPSRREHDFISHFSVQWPTTAKFHEKMLNRCKVLEKHYWKWPQK